MKNDCKYSIYKKHGLYEITYTLQANINEAAK